VRPARRALVVPVAGISERFRQSVGSDVLKCLYHEDRIEDSILYFTACYAASNGFDVVRFVGGYRYEQLTAALRTPALSRKASGRDFGCVFNPAFETTGAGQSVYLGLRDVLEQAPDVEEIVLLEGDVVGDAKTLEALAVERGDVLTSCPEPITARRSVVLYRTTAGELRFAFDERHRSLTIAEPFQEIYNSGQAWKFADLPRLRRTMNALTHTDLDGTGLSIFERYFEGSSDPSVIAFETWVNCNTLADYHRALPVLQREVSRWNG
jgi:hypothetical protein